ncbi:MAG: 30S ribosomal protein S3 [Candidatus Eisenbacteria bacterium]|uniref:Small ribosomal subunit protein uS3 n=1 Tax=Eiseniibacteriota bacterium TaxID=2212470 RepID=A0A956LYJ0_UNCEI|nr:30S ribosomal protein S3 [Candidatus Eisenbacteria bacterium]
MGQKTHPIGFRLGVIKTWDSRWFANRDYPDLLKEDLFIRKYLNRRLPNSGISKIVIERRGGTKIEITVHTAKPGMVIGRSGAQVNQLRDELQHITGREVFIDIKSIDNPDLDARLVAENIARQLEGRVSFRRAMKKAVSSTMRSGAQGIRVRAGGRLGGAEMARVEAYREGRVPLHTLRADIDFATATAVTTYGSIGVKVWIFLGEVLGADEPVTTGTPGTARDSNRPMRRGA